MPGSATFLVNRLRSPAVGLEGGQPGAAASLEINGVASDAAAHYVLRHGDRVRVETGGGGGFGVPKRNRSR